MYTPPQVKPIIGSNSDYLSDSSSAPSVYLPNPLFVLVGGGVFLVILTLAMLSLLKPHLDGYRLSRGGVRVNGKVDSVETYSVKNGKRGRINYSFSSAEGLVMAMDEGLMLSEVAGLTKGSPVPVTYLGSNASVSSLGVPGKLWGTHGANKEYLLTCFMFVPLYGAVAWYVFKAARERTLETALCKGGKVVEGEAISMESTEPHRGRVTTTLTYRVPVQGGSVIGHASYWAVENQIRRTRAGEKIPILVLDEDRHRPL